MPSASFYDLLLYSCDSLAIENMVGRRTSQNVYRWSNSRSQLVYRIAHGLIEIIRFLSIHSLVESLTDIGAG